jgi:molybdopterin synthase sulfur carrier subunit
MSSSNLITVKFFASLRERLGSSQEVLPHCPDLTVQGLEQQLMSRGGVWQEAFRETAGLRASVNHEISPMNRVLQPGDEVAFFPPVTGG